MVDVVEIIASLITVLLSVTLMGRTRVVMTWLESVVTQLITALVRTV